MWGKKAKIEEWYDPIKIWQDWAENVTGNSIDCGHYLPEEKPDETCNHLLNFSRTSPKQEKLKCNQLNQQFISLNCKI